MTFEVVPQLMAMAQGGGEEKWNSAQVKSSWERAPHGDACLILPLKQKFSCRILLAMGGRLDGEEAMVATLEGEQWLEGNFKKSDFLMMKI